MNQGYDEAELCSAPAQKERERECDKAGDEKKGNLEWEEQGE